MKILTICGSLRFSDEMKRMAFELAAIRGYNVLSCMYNEDHLELSPEMCDNLSKAHFKKIDLSDVVYIMDVDGYIGESTMKEIEYAKSRGKDLLFYSDEKQEAEPGSLKQ